MNGTSRTQKGNELEVWQPATPAVQYGVMQVWFLTRLRRMVRLRREQSELLSPEGLRLLDWAIYSTFCDCLEQGVANEGRSIIRTERAVHAE